MKMTREEWLREFRKELKATGMTEKETEEEVNSGRTQSTIGLGDPKYWAELVTM